MPRKYTEAQKRAYKKYIGSTDEIRFRVPKGRKDEIKAYAEARGETIGRFIDTIVTEAIEKNGN